MMPESRTRCANSDALHRRADSQQLQTTFLLFKLVLLPPRSEISLSSSQRNPTNYRPSTKTRSNISHHKPKRTSRVGASVRIFLQCNSACGRTSIRRSGDLLPGAGLDLIGTAPYGDNGREKKVRSTYYSSSHAIQPQRPSYFLLLQTNITYRKCNTADYSERPLDP